MDTLRRPVSIPRSATKRFRAAGASVALALAVSGSACGGPSFGVSSDEILLGSFAPLTGEYASLGNVARAMNAYFEWVNSQGGVHGRMIRLSLKDDQYNPSVTREAVTELLREEGVFALVGGLGSANCLAVKDDVWNRLTPWVNPGSSHRVWVDPVNAYTFSIMPSSITAARELTRYALANLEINRIAMVAEDSEFGNQGQEGYRLGIRSHLEYLESIEPEGTEFRYARITGRPRRPRTGNPESEGWLTSPASGDGTLWRVTRPEGGRWNRPELAFEDVASRRVGRDGQNLEAVIAELKEKQVDAVMLWGIAEYGATVAKAIHADDEWSPMLLGSFAMSDPQMLDLAGEAWEGAVVASTTPDLNADNEHTRRVKEILNQFAPDVPFGDFAVLGMSWAELMVEGLERAGPDLTRLALLQGLETLDGWEGLIGHPVSFTTEDHHGMDTVTVKRVEDGTFVMLTDWIE